MSRRPAVECRCVSIMLPTRREALPCKVMCLAFHPLACVFGPEREAMTGIVVD